MAEEKKLTFEVMVGGTDPVFLDGQMVQPAETKHPPVKLTVPTVKQMEPIRKVVGAGMKDPYIDDEGQWIFESSRTLEDALDRVKELMFQDHEPDFRIWFDLVQTHSQHLELQARSMRVLGIPALVRAIKEGAGGN